MAHGRPAAGLLAATLLLLAAPAVHADRVLSQKAYLPHNMGVRGDMTVPWLTNGPSTLGAYQMVAPRMYNSPRLDGPPGTGSARPVYNIIFYGSRLGFGDASTGATPRPPNNMRPNGK